MGSIPTGGNLFYSQGALTAAEVGNAKAAMGEQGVCSVLFAVRDCPLKVQFFIKDWNKK
jgi:hypothetical protein